MLMASIISMSENDQKPSRIDQKHNKTGSKMSEQAEIYLISQIDLKIVENENNQLAP